MTDYTTSFSDELLSMLMRAMNTGDQSELRKSAVGRAYLLESAIKRRRLPLQVRRFPRMAGRAAAGLINRLAIEALEGAQGCA